MWDERYSREDYVYGVEPNDFLVEVYDRLPAGRVLCLAEGEGRNAAWLAGQGRQVTSVDGSEVGVRKTLKLAEARGVVVDARCADLADFEIAPQSFDVIVSVFGHVPPDLRRDLHARCVAGLKPGGAMALEAYTPDQLAKGTGGPPVAELMMTADALRAELAGLEFAILRERVREVIEGVGHTGEAAVVQMLAVKPAG